MHAVHKMDANCGFVGEQDFAGALYPEKKNERFPEVGFKLPATIRQGGLSDRAGAPGQAKP
jgi:hypothetical protein